MVEHDFFTIWQFLPFNFECLLQFHWILTLNVYIDFFCSMEATQRLCNPIKLTACSSFDKLQVRYALCRFIRLKPWSRSINVIVTNQFLILSHYSFQSISRFRWVCNAYRKYKLAVFSESHSILVETKRRTSSWLQDILICFVVVYETFNLSEKNLLHIFWTIDSFNSNFSSSNRTLVTF